MLFKFQIEETLSKEFLVEAQTEEEAEKLLRDKYKSEEIVLTADDFVGNQFISQGVSYSDREPDFSTSPDLPDPTLDDGYSDLELADDAELDKLGPDEPDDPELVDDGYSDLELIDDDDLDR